MRLIRSKLERPGNSPHLARPRVAAALRASVASGLSTFVVGRAGTGKSVAALDLAATRRDGVAWYTTDASDSDFTRFATYLAEALGLEPHDDVGTVGVERTADRLLVDLFERANAPGLLAIEDLHAVYDAPWFEPFLARFLPLLPSHVHVLVTARALPPVPLWRMRSKQTLSVVDEETLAFTEPEAVSLFARYGLSEASARAAWRSARGRAALLDATARALAGHGPAVEAVAFPAHRLRRVG